jgi:hypothetical protein
MYIIPQFTPRPYPSLRGALMMDYVSIPGRAPPSPHTMHDILARYACSARYVQLALAPVTARSVLVTLG